MGSTGLLHFASCRFANMDAYKWHIIAGKTVVWNAA